MSEIRLADVHFAHSIDMEPMLKHLTTMRYHNGAIIECINGFVLSGLIRPIIGSAILLDEDSSENNVVASYIIDHVALQEYVEILLFTNISVSMTFYNMALRARYNIRSDRHIDNMTYEIYTFLSFLFDLLDREIALEEQIRGAGVMFKPLSARIRTGVSILSEEFRKIDNKSIADRKEQLGLRIKTRSMIDEARWRLSKQAGII